MKLYWLHIFMYFYDSETRLAKLHFAHHHTGLIPVNRDDDFNQLFQHIHSPKQSNKANPQAPKQPIF